QSHDPKSGTSACYEVTRGVAFTRHAADGVSKIPKVFERLLLDECKQRIVCDQGKFRHVGCRSIKQSVITCKGFLIGGSDIVGDYQPVARQIVERNAAECHTLAVL